MPASEPSEAEARLYSIQKSFLDSQGYLLGDEAITRIQGTLDLLRATFQLAPPPLPFVDVGTYHPHELDAEEVNTQLVSLGIALEASNADEALYACKNLDEEVAIYLGSLFSAHSRVSRQGNITVDVAFMSSVTRIARDLDILRSSDSLSESAAQIRNLDTEMSKILENARNASGAVAEMKLAEQFTELEKNERESANEFRAWTIVFLAVGIVGSIAFYVYNQFYSEDADPIKIGYSAVIVGAIFGLSGYFARQAKHHRDLADWGKTISVQLLTFNAFMDSVDDNQVRNSARLAFASRVFGPGPQSENTDAVAPNSVLLEQLLSLLSPRSTSSK